MNRGGLGGIIGRENFLRSHVHATDLSLAKIARAVKLDFKTSKAK